ncbi:undecaprenyl-diphosphate phosphatase [Chryseolinea lacunae]|uniref:Undecaprenyl-diphosphatase n=1 Tax=Chryseolinea lacunae TaxID=2801331 RepID=A0ABS1KWY5_9BACT|nr:undecaprenyl-diphosphate phosphatase [Chryseolinea lacunae]MBL0743965.1 undecaprenyl-diphosphate phosphatase [Chryseolinea lacunae]
MSIFQAIVLAIIEGITEFLPVSSTGHMIIGSSLMGIASDPFTKMFTVAIQFGAILSVIVLYWKRFLPDAKSFKDTLFFYLKLLVAFLPAAVAGLLLNDYIDALLERVDVVGYMLVAGGIFFLFLDQIFHANETNGTETVTFPTALKIGVFQTIAMIPGVSRSAATIIGGLTQKLTKKTAAEFSFFLAVPTMFAATLYKMYKFYGEGGSFGSHEITLLAVGNIVAFIVAILAIKSFISFLTRNGFKVFGYYRIIVGVAILVLYYLGVGLTIV